MNDTFPHDTSGGAASVYSVRGRSGSTVGPSGSHYIIGPLQKASGPGKKENTAMSHFWDTHHRYTEYNRNQSDNMSEYNADPYSDRRNQIRIQIHDIIKNSNLSACQRKWSIF